MDNPLNDPKQFHDFLFNLYDFSAWLQTVMQDETNPEHGHDFFFAFMVYIEDMMDVYGRKLIADAARAANIDDRQALAEAHRRIDLLRAAMNSVKQQNPGATNAIDEAAKRLKDNWGTRE